MTKLRILMGALLVAMLLITLIGCGDAGASTAASQPSFVLCLFDASGTTKDERNSYLRDFNSIVDQLQGGDSLWADAITENCLATARIPVRLELPAFSVLTANQDDYDDQIRGLKQKARASAETLTSTQMTPRTAILDSMLLAQKLFRGDRAKTASHRVLVIFSDMREDSERYCFDREILTPSRIRQVVAAEKAGSRIPELGEVTVYVTGATADRKGDPGQIRRIQAFWQAYFRAAGTELPDEHYAASLLSFSLPGERRTSAMNQLSR